MPFAGVHRPAIGVSLLKAALKKLNISTKIYYFNLDFARKIGLKLYDKIAEQEYAGSSLIGELIFSNFVFGKFSLNKKSIEQALSRVFDKRYGEWTENDLYNATNEIMMVQKYIPDFLEKCKNKVIEENPDLIGFTSTFHQNCASLSLSKKLKNIKNVPIIFGGANCEGDMGATLLKIAPWIDYVCSGEGDISFIEFMKYFLKGSKIPKINGIITRESSFFETALTSPIMDMDNLPYPDFDDYFRSCKSSQLYDELFPSLVIETSRGCWWGEKSQCTFCGLNGSTMKFRSKSISRALNELIFLTNRHKINTFLVVDNILDLKYIENLFPQISKNNLNLNLFYETKANLSKKQLLLMKNGGVTNIQPGIESLSNKVLKLMKKGVSALQNIQLLKWCMEIGIHPYWNIIWGFPNEPEEEYERMAKIVPLLYHIVPPVGFGKIVMDRFSPYFLEPLQNGLVNVRPAAAYNFVYPLDNQELSKLAYHFEYDYEDGRNPAIYVKKLKENVFQWRKIWKSNDNPILVIYNMENMAMIKDTRPCAIQPIHILAEEEAKIFDICDSIHSFDSIMLKLKDDYHQINRDDVKEALTNLINNKVLINDNNNYLSLAVKIK